VERLQVERMDPLARVAQVFEGAGIDPGTGPGAAAAVV
jgi:hypothetical protein